MQGVPEAAPVRSVLPCVPDLTPIPQREMTSTDLLNGAKEILIRHGSDTYRLRLTRNGKLILHK